MTKENHSYASLNIEGMCSWSDSLSRKVCYKPTNEKKKKSFMANNDFSYSYHAEVTSNRTNLSPFTKDYRGLALQCDYKVCVAREGTR